MYDPFGEKKTGLFYKIISSQKRSATRCRQVFTVDDEDDSWLGKCKPHFKFFFPSIQ